MKKSACCLGAVIVLTLMGGNAFCAPSAEGAAAETTSQVEQLNKQVAPELSSDSKKMNADDTVKEKIKEKRELVKKTANEDY
jgi:plastocyanin domain-containing protein